MNWMRRGIAAVALAIGLASPAAAGDYNGNFMIRLQATGVISQDSLNSLLAGPIDLKAAGFDAEVSDRVLPTATLTYFLNRNLAVELFCCFSKHHVTLQPPAGAAALAGKVADTWLFPPALTLQYHFDGLGAFKPYVGIGGQYIVFFNESTADNTLGAQGVKMKDAFGITLQAGFDLALGHGWYLNADIKKTWLDTTATWQTAAAVGGRDIVAKVDIDPLIVSVGVGYRFNLGDIFGHRQDYGPLK